MTNHVIDPNMQFGFDQALYWLRASGRVTREGWNGKDMYIELQLPDENSKMTLPYIFMKTVTGDKVPWLASQSDILGTDWKVYTPAQ